MPEQYVASDKRTGVEVSVTGDFPPHPDDRMRIARTTTLFTRLTSTLLATENESERREGFRAVETQLELADALIRRDTDDVRRLVRQTMETMGVTQEQLDDLARQLRELGGLDDATAEQITQALGLDGTPPGAAPPDGAPPDGDPPDRSAKEYQSGGSGEVPPDDRPDWPPPPDTADESSGDDDESNDTPARPA